MIKITDLKIDPASLGSKFILADIRPSYIYVGGEKTQGIDGYKYYVVLPSHKMEKISVKVLKNAPLVLEGDEIPIGTLLEFSNLEVGSYFSNGQININAKADSVRFVGEKK